MPQHLRKEDQVVMAGHGISLRWLGTRQEFLPAHSYQHSTGRGGGGGGEAGAGRFNLLIREKRKGINIRMKEIMSLLTNDKIICVKNNLQMLVTK